MEFEWNIFPGNTPLQLVQEVQQFMNKTSDPEQFQGRIIFMWMFNDIIWRKKTMKQNVLLIPHLCLYLQKDFQQDVGHSSDLDQKQSGIPPTMKNLEGNGTEVAELMMIRFGESGHPVFRATSPLSRGTLKCKGGGKLPFHFCADWGFGLKLFFAQLFLLISSASTEQSQICVKNTVAVEQER